jgi:arylsulfatase A-like enzyme
MDQQLARLLHELEQRGLRKNTLVIITSDHGEHFKEHGFLGHGESLYRREIHVPLLIIPPGGGQGEGRTIAEPVSLRDMAATVVDLLGLEAGSPFPGRSLAAHWRSAPGSPPPQTSPVLSEVGHRKHDPRMPAIPATLGTVDALVAEGKVYIRNGNGREELFDLKSDPLEQTNLADDPAHRAALLRLRARLDEARADHRGPPPQGGLTLSPPARNDSAMAHLQR